MTTRRGLMASGAGLLVASCTAITATLSAADRFAAVEQQIGGRLGVCAIDTATSADIGYRMEESFALASTFKWLLAAAILKRCEDGLKLDDTLYYTASDILPNSLVTEANINIESGMGALSLEQLCGAIVTVSDNAAANLLFVPMFGPEGLTSFLRAAGDSRTRLDRRETELNENKPHDVRDTTTPKAMARTLHRFLATDHVLNAGSRDRLNGWMARASTGLDRLRAGLPKEWKAGDKTGTGGNGSHNDCCIAWPPGRPPIVIASYISESYSPNDAKAAAHADVARIVVREWG